MKPAHSTNINSDDESDGEEEVLGTWKATGKGKITVVATTGKPTKPRTVTPRSSTTKASKKANGKPKTQKPRAVNKQSENIVQQPPQPPAAPIAPRPCTAKASGSSALRAVWYLGGNHVVKLLTSVDGDLDHKVLSKVAAVPSVVGELALSVEALVSDDFTVGDFEDDMLAKIAANTLEAKRASSTKESVPAPAPVVTKVATPVPVTVEAPRVTISENSTVPNPLASYKPVPNPLARITPPGSPVPKRKDVITTSSMPAAKRARITVPAPIKAR